MPRATRSTRRQPEGTREVHEDNDENTEPVTTSRKGGKGKKVAKPEPSSRAVEAGHDDEDEGPAPEIDIKPFDPDAFEDQPLSKDDNIKLSGFAKDWQIVLDSVEKKAFRMIAEVAGAVTELASEEEGKEYIDNDLEPLIREVMDIQNHVCAEKEAVQEIQQRLMRGDDVVNACEDINIFVNAADIRWEQSTSRQKYAKNKYYFNYRTAIWEGKHQDAMPPLTNSIPKEDGDPEEDDDDVEIGGVTQDFRCPLTLTFLEDPYSSTVCQHSYNRDSILDYLKSGSKKCPATGCNAILTLRNVEANEDLAKRAKAYQKRVARREANEDVEELSDSE